MIINVCESILVATLHVKNTLNVILFYTNSRLLTLNVKKYIKR